MKPLRQAMPLVTEFIDLIRDQFDVDGETPVHDAIRRGVAGGCEFYASEAGHTVGNRRPDRGVWVPLSDCILAKPEKTGGVR